MIWVTKQAIERYSRRDMVQAAMNAMIESAETRSTCHAWLANSLPKRFIFNKFYGDLLADGKRRSVLDIGGGLTGFTEQLALQHDYNLVDLMAHDIESSARSIENRIGRKFLYVEDWWAYLKRDQDTHWDIVIANDLLPNVDQRLVPFLDSLLPRAKKILISLTYYNDWRWYTTRRIDADEVLTQMSWDSQILSSVIERFRGQIIEPDFSGFHQELPSVYSNGRQVCLVTFAGAG